MKFDFCIGNPPYQDETLGENGTFAPPVYDKFLDAAYSISERVEMIHPARFLFNAGSTPIALSYILGFDETIAADITKHNFRQVDALVYAKKGTLAEKLQEVFGEK